MANRLVSVNDTHDLPAPVQAKLATAAQGAKADTAVQPAALGTAAAADVGDFATAAQGAKADTAVQPAALGALAAKNTVAIADISATGTADGTTFLRGDGSWAAAGGGGGGTPTILGATLAGGAGTETAWGGWADYGSTHGKIRAQTYGGSAYMHAKYNSFVTGYVQHNGSGGKAYLQGYQSNLVGGDVRQRGNTGYVGLRGSSRGNFVFGRAYGGLAGGANATVKATQVGGWAGGYAKAKGANAYVLSGGKGAIAFGYAYGDGGGAGQVSATGTGSGAFGYADGGQLIQASAKNSFQFGPGGTANGVENSLRVGAGPRLCGGIPAAPANGDIWVDGSGNVIIRSAGISVTIA